MGMLDTSRLLIDAAGNLQKLISSVKSPTRMAVYPIDNADGTKTYKDVYADVIFSYNYKESVKITENPVMQGIKVNDHRIIEPKKLSIEVGVSNIVGLKDALLSAAGAGQTLLQATKLMIFGNRFDSRSRVAATYSQLQVSMYNGEPFDLETPLGTYKNMLITGLSSLQDSDTISVFKGTIDFQELITFQNAVVGGKYSTAIKGGLKQTIVPSLIPTSLRF